MTLTNAQKSAISRADRGAVVSALAGLQIPANGRWFSAAFPYSSGRTTEKLADIKANGREQRLVELLAVSSPNHCFDGWGYLARAISAALAGDLHGTRHFAYYAELRAALSILNGVGIGVFNNWNCTVDQNGGLHSADPPRSRTRTHDMTWLALTEWGARQTAGQLLGNALAIRSEGFSSILKTMWPGSTISFIAADWIKSWGLDLAHPDNDHHARDQSSYDPQALNPLPKSAFEVFDFVANFWELFNPKGHSPFEEIDRVLVRLLIEAHVKAVNGAGVAQQTIQSEIDKAYNNLGPMQQSAIPRDFLVRAVLPDDPLVIRTARQMQTPVGPLSVAARAILLLRLATALVSDLMYQAGIDPEINMDFWQDAFGESRGFWSNGGKPQPLKELWYDVEDALLDVEVVKEACGADFDFNNWFSIRENGLPRLHEAERIALWGVCR